MTRPSLKGRMDGFAECLAPQGNETRDQQDIDEILYAATLSSLVRSRVGMEFFRNLRTQWVAADFRRRDPCERQQVGAFDKAWLLDDGVSHAHVDAEAFKITSVEQASHWKSIPAKRSTGRAGGGFADLELKPVAEIQTCSFSQFVKHSPRGHLFQHGSVDVHGCPCRLTELPLKSKPAFQHPSLPRLLGDSCQQPIESNAFAETEQGEAGLKGESAMVEHPRGERITWLACFGLLAATNLQVSNPARHLPDPEIELQRKRDIAFALVTAVDTSLRQTWDAFVVAHSFVSLTGSNTVPSSYGTRTKRTAPATTGPSPRLVSRTEMGLRKRPNKTQRP